jgi:ubiquinone/menaquinone biosynthesis C-methylase UbiE
MATPIASGRASPDGDAGADWTAAQRALYDGVAPHYDDAIPRHVAQHYLRKRVALVGEYVPPGAKVLDVGCGTGTLAAALRAAGYAVYGVDQSAGMLGQMGRSARGTPVAGLCQGLPFGDGGFDLAITVATLHHITDPHRIAETIGEMCRVTRAGGHVVIWDHNPNNPYWPILMKRVPQDTGEERLVPQAEIVGDLRASGIAETQIRARRSGLMPDFTPPRLVKVVALVEAVVERVPGLNIFCAHNVVVAHKLAP